MESLFGIVGDGYVMIAADTAAIRSVVKFKNNEDKIYELDSQKVMGVTGPVGDRVNFTEYIIRNIHLYALRNGISLSTHAAANWTRNELANALRQHPYEVFMLIGGYDAHEGPSLYYMDYLASLQKLDKAAHGYAAYFVLSIMDRYWKPNMNLEEGLELIQKCIAEVKRRFIVNTPNFVIKVVDNTGVRQINLGDDEEKAQ
eukprot:TRINITY_DN1431_c0_g1_i1.p1 TRINITY_DN1431_c0_g1~~TRINITY_DN1431_c0_g1_i1.p1  ORF type:complete len:201 (+),score=40.29 TRINITY_DN1431_c0_g1_i1:70-672(+)